MISRLLWMMLVVLVVGDIAYRYLDESVTVVDAAVVEIGDIASSISISGKVVGDREISLMPRISSQVIEVPVKENDLVREGQTLVRLDARAEEAQLEEATASLREAEPELAIAQRKYENALRQLRAGGVSRTDLANRLSRRDAARAKLKRAAAALKSAQLRKDYTIIKAPFDARILEVSARSGMSVTTGTALLRLAGIGSYEVDLAVDAGDIQDVYPQQSVELTSEALPGQKWKAVVLRIAPVVDSNRQGNLVNVRTSLPQDAPLKLGQQVDALVITAEKSSALVLPFSAIQQGDEQQVAVVKGGMVRWRNVRTGIEDLSRIEILSGVAAGETVVLDPPEGLRDGQRVEIGPMP